MLLNGEGVLNKIARKIKNMKKMEYSDKLYIHFRAKYNITSL